LWISTWLSFWLAVIFRFLSCIITAIPSMDFYSNRIFLNMWSFRNFLCTRLFYFLLVVSHGLRSFFWLLVWFWLTWNSVYFLNLLGSSSVSWISFFWSVVFFFLQLFVAPHLRPREPCLFFAAIPIKCIFFHVVTMFTFFPTFSFQLSPTFLYHSVYRLLSPFFIISLIHCIFFLLMPISFIEMLLFLFCV
jgi:hypothetical protein